MKDCRLTKADILRHYGYDPRVYINLSCGLWPKEKVFERLSCLKSYMDCIGHKKIRATLDFDPDYERAIFRIEHIPDATEESG